MRESFKNGCLLISANISKRSIRWFYIALIAFVSLFILYISNFDFADKTLKPEPSVEEEIEEPSSYDFDYADKTLKPELSLDVRKEEPKPFPKRRIQRPERKIKLPIHDQEDSELVKYVRSTIIPPSDDVRYNLKKNVFDHSLGQARAVIKLTHFKHDGFFVEVGAGNGEQHSNTLLLERHLGWKGLLIEAYPRLAEDLLGLNRRAWFSPSCLSHNRSAYESVYRESTLFVSWVLEQGRHYRAPRTSTMKVPCYPLYTFMLALNVTTIDYLSLDVADNEVQVLESIPFDKLDITIVSVEASKAAGGAAGVTDVMLRRGYKTVMSMGPDDFIFAKKRYVVPYDHRDLLK